MRVGGIQRSSCSGCKRPAEPLHSPGVILCCMCVYVVCVCHGMHVLIRSGHLLYWMDSRDDLSVLVAGVGGALTTE